MPGRVLLSQRCERSTHLEHQQGLRQLVRHGSRQRFGAQGWAVQQLAPLAGRLAERGVFVAVQQVDHLLLLHLGARDLKGSAWDQARVQLCDAPARRMGHAQRDWPRAPCVRGGVGGGDHQSPRVR